MTSAAWGLKVLITSNMWVCCFTVTEDSNPIELRSPVTNKCFQKSTASRFRASPDIFFPAASTDLGVGGDAGLHQSCLRGEDRWHPGQTASSSWREPRGTSKHQQTSCEVSFQSIWCARLCVVGGWWRRTIRRDQRKTWTLLPFFLKDDLK